MSICLRDYPIENVGSLYSDVTRPLYQKLDRIRVFVIGVTDVTLPLILLPFIFCAVCDNKNSFLYFLEGTISNVDFNSIRKSPKLIQKRRRYGFL